MVRCARLSGKGEHDEIKRPFLGQTNSKREEARASIRKGKSHVVLGTKLVPGHILCAEAERLEHVFASVQDRGQIIWLPPLLLESHLLVKSRHLVSLVWHNYVAQCSTILETAY